MNDLFDKVRASAAALGETIAEWNRKFGAPVMDTCADVRSSSPTSGGFVERELAVARGLASSRGDDERLDEADAELSDLRRACREGWRYANELEQERSRLQGEAVVLRRMLSDSLTVLRTVEPDDTYEAERLEHLCAAVTMALQTKRDGTLL